MPEPGFICPFAIGDINRNSDVTCEGLILIEPRHSNVEDPARLPVVPPKPIFHLEFFLPIKRLRVRVKASLQILRVDTFRPTISQFLFK
jgi:hypothetical protein